MTKNNPNQKKTTNEDGATFNQQNIHNNTNISYLQHL